MKRMLLFFFLVSIIYIPVYAVENILMVYKANLTYSNGKIDEIVNLFNEAHEGIRVSALEIEGEYIEEVEKLVFNGQNMSGKSYPDLILMDIGDFQEIEDEKLLFPLDLYIRLDEFFLDDFFYELTSLFGCCGKLYCLPVGFTGNYESVVSCENGFVLKLPGDKSEIMAWGINNQSYAMEESWELLKYLTLEGQKLLMGDDGYIPSRKSLIDF